MTDAYDEMLDCSAALQRVYLYLDGEIGDVDVAEARAHVEDCAPCLREYGIEEEVKRLVRRSCGCEQLPDGMRDRILVRLREVSQTATGTHVTETTITISED
jgi:mycothiol system anti-sigma-R factor